MQPLTKEQLEQADIIVSVDKSLKGIIRAWACGVHGQKKLSYLHFDGKVQVKCELCGASNNWIVRSACFDMWQSTNRERSK